MTAPPRHDLGRQTSVRPGIEVRVPAADHGHGLPAGIDRRGMRRAVDPERETGDDRRASTRDGGGEPRGDRPTRARGAAGADDRDRTLSIERRRRRHG